MMRLAGMALTTATELVAGDPDLSIADPPDGFAISIYAVWNAYRGGYPAWFGLCEDNIEVKGIDEPTLSKLRNFLQ